MEYNFRRANVKDAVFISKVIIEAEKSGTDKIGMANVFNLTETELQTYLIQILKEEIDGCEFSVSSFILAEYDNKPVAGVGGWIEEENEDEQQSAILKSNLISYFFPKENVLLLQKKQELLKDVQIIREPHTHQLEFGFVDENHRGKGLITKLFEEQIRCAKIQNPKIKKSQLQAFENNVKGIRAYERGGYKTILRKESTNSDILKYLPWNVKIVMEKEL